ncbi:MAG: sensor histidine kinase [Bacteroidetes bacterium]|nr:sensor histidine kinase [Bacteroidota bacterium]
MALKNNNIQKTILIFSFFGALFYFIFSIIVHYFFISLNFYATLLLTMFAVFLSTFVILYYLYFVKISGLINILNEKIRMRFLSKQIPDSQNVLDEEDSISNLEKKIEQLIEEREKELTHFQNLDSYRKEYLGNVSHELKTPVFNIQGYIDTLLNGGLEDEKINVNYLTRAEKSVDRLIHILDDLETISQLEIGGLKLDVEPFDLALLVKDIFISLEMIAGKQHIQLLLAKKYEKPVMVIADKFRIRQVLVNLINNSIKYGKQNGTTLITLTPLNNDIVVEVKDDGQGIEKEHLLRIFERFYRVDKGRSREQGGTGLGLSIVKHILDAHHKTIVAESALNKGTKFTFSLQAQ